MRWEIERYVRLYRRDTPEWTLIPWRARGLFDELLRKVDLDGTLECGRLDPARAVSIAIHAPPEDVPEIDRLLSLLLADGCVKLLDPSGNRGRRLYVPNYRSAQEMALTGAERQARWREKAVGAGRAKTKGNSEQVDAGDKVTPRAEPSRADPAEPSRSIARDASGTERERDDPFSMLPGGDATPTGRAPPGEPTVVEQIRNRVSTRLRVPRVGAGGLVLPGRKRLSEFIQDTNEAVKKHGMDHVVETLVVAGEAMQARGDPPETMGAFCGEMRGLATSTPESHSTSGTSRDANSRGESYRSKFASPTQ